MNLNVVEEYLTNKDTHVFDPALSTPNLLEVIQNFRDNVESRKDIRNFLNCGLVIVLVPQSCAFPEVIEWCASNYDPAMRVVLSVDSRKVVIDVTFEALANFPRH